MALGIRAGSELKIEITYSYLIEHPKDMPVEGLCGNERIRSDRRRRRASG